MAPKKQVKGEKDPGDVQSERGSEVGRRLAQSNRKGWGGRTVVNQGAVARQPRAGGLTGFIQGQGFPGKIQ